MGVDQAISGRVSTLTAPDFREMLISRLGLAVVSPSGDWEVPMASTGSAADATVTAAKPAKQQPWSPPSRGEFTARLDVGPGTGW